LNNLASLQLHDVPRLTQRDFRKRIKRICMSPVCQWRLGLAAPLVVIYIGERFKSVQATAVRVTHSADRPSQVPIHA